MAYSENVNWNWCENDNKKLVKPLQIFELKIWEILGDFNLFYWNLLVKTLKDYSKSKTFQVECNQSIWNIWVYQPLTPKSLKFFFGDALLGLWAIYNSRSNVL